jgi:hypothetical protein
MTYTLCLGDAHAMPLPADVWPVVCTDGLDLAAAGTLAGPGASNEREPTA